MKNKITLLAVFLSTFAIYAQDPNILWQRTIGGSDWDQSAEIVETRGGGFIIGGFSDSNISGDKTENSRGGYDYWLLKFDNDGKIEWQKTYGGDQDDSLSDIKETSDGGYIVVGTSISGVSGDKTGSSKGGRDYWILKLDNSGNIEWQKTIGGDQDDSVPKVLQIADGGYLIGGTSKSDISGDRTAPHYASSDAWVLKLNNDGDIQWQKGYQLAGSFMLGSLRTTNDGGYVLGGTDSNTDYAVIKISSEGNYIWSKIYGGNGIDSLTNITVLTDGGYIVSGFSDSDISGDKTEDSRGFEDYWLLKIDSTGNIEWQKTLGGNLGEACYSVIESLEGGYFITGYSDSNISGDKTENSNGDSDYWIIKLNDTGIIEWQNTIGGLEAERIPKAIQTTDGSYLISGQSRSDISGDKSENSRGSWDLWIIKHASTLGIEENTFAKAITLYPNPAKNTLQLNTQDQTINQVNIYTMTGSRMMQLDMGVVSPTVDVSSLASGVYFMQLYSGKNVTLKKFVKE